MSIQNEVRRDSFIYALCRDYVYVCKDGAETSETIRYDRHGDRESDTCVLLQVS